MPIPLVLHFSEQNNTAEQSGHGIGQMTLLKKNINQHRHKIFKNFIIVCAKKD
jgi:hypothetical protein